MAEMKTLTIGGIKYEVVDEAARTELADKFGPENPPTAAQVGAVSKAGGDTINGELTVAENLNLRASTGAHGELFSSETGTYLSHLSAALNVALALNPSKELAEMIRFRTIDNDDSGKITYYTLFGEHSRSNGTYTGNGSATSRSITIGGLGWACFIYKSNSDVFAIATSQGAIVKNGTALVAVSSSEIKYLSGVLTIATTSEHFNTNGTTYYYRCIFT